MQNMKKIIDNSNFLYFFHNLGPNLAQILPQDNTHFIFFAGFQRNILRDLININNYDCNPVVLKRIW